MFYVYAILDPRKPGNFNRNPHKKRKIEKILAAGKKLILQKIQSDMLEEDAYQLEERAIKTIGRMNIDRRTPLTNIDKGGRIAPSLTAAQKAKISETKKQQFQSGEKIHPWIGRKHTKESIKKIKDNHSHCWSGKQHTRESKDKIGKANRGKRYPTMCNTYKLTSPDGTIYTVNTGLKYFCKEHGLHLPSIRKVTRRVQRHHKNWSTVKIFTAKTQLRDT